MTARLIYVDNIRVFCMMFGIVYHAAGMVEHSVADAVRVMSPMFRMQAFYLVAGYLAAMMLMRRGTVAFLGRRWLAIGLPLVSTLVLVNPAILYLIDGFNGGSYADARIAPYNGGYELHLWFLVVLLGYVTILIALDPLMRRFARLCDGRKPDMLVLIGALVLALWPMLVVEVLARIPTLRLMLPFFGNLPWFLIGAAAFHGPAIWAACHRATVPLLAGAAALAVLSQYYTAAEGLGWGKVATLSRGVMVVAVVVSLMALFRRFGNMTGAVQRLLSESIYTVYLFHTLLLYGIAWAFGMYRGDLTLLHWVGFTAFALLAGLAIHVWVIRPVPLLAFLFNGKPMQATTARA
ncbi:acyltransferase family protein [Paracoccus sp. (in: a-proteobacteria)]|uniref:acyltransferase family protein n=1 Tax=Paracoccus sp. TaxID=267 RepID=UPI0026E097EA|nr:acyltransferase family protein [Paracoccus sp. (in: a-proteobacteria)]MDO5647785.1 acyltransferase family protein [Paracoccus sp. (in: a-proteobacteria)]